MFSPQNRDYNVSVVPQPLDHDAPDEGSTSARPPAGTDVMVSWFSTPDPALGAGNGSRLSFASGGYTYNPVGSAEELKGVRIPIWSTKCLGARWYGPAPATPLIDADLRPAGPDRLEGTVVNRSGTALNDAILAYNGHVYLLGTIAPGQSIRVELSHQDRQLAPYIRSKFQNYMPVNYYNANVKNLNRADLLLDLMFHDSTRTLSSETDVPSNALHDLDLSGLLALERPMLVARIDRPTSRLVLKDAPSAPKIEQTTLLRVILTLKKENDGNEGSTK
jgi:hypothetical protein